MARTSIVWNDDEDPKWEIFRRPGDDSSTYIALYYNGGSQLMSEKQFELLLKAVNEVMLSTTDFPTQ